MPITKSRQSQAKTVSNHAGAKPKLKVIVLKEKAPTALEIRTKLVKAAQKKTSTARKKGSVGAQRSALRPRPSMTIGLSAQNHLANLTREEFLQRIKSSVTPSASVSLYQAPPVSPKPKIAAKKTRSQTAREKASAGKSAKTNLISENATKVGVKKESEIWDSKGRIRALYR